MVARQRAFLADKDVRGRIYISHHGINCQAGGRAADARAYVDWIAAQPEFKGVYYTLWPAAGHVHPKLRLKERSGLISLAGGADGLGVTDPAKRATPLAPQGWREMLREADKINARVAAGEEDPVSGAGGMGLGGLGRRSEGWTAVDWCGSAPLPWLTVLTAPAASPLTHPTNPLNSHTIISIL